VKQGRKRLFLIGLAAWTAVSAAVFAGQEDPNLSGQTAELRRQIQEEQIQPLFLSMTAVSEIDLDSLIANLERLNVPSSGKKAAAETVSATVSAPDTAGSPTVSDEKTNASVSINPTPQVAGKAAASSRLETLDQVEQPIEPMGAADALFRCGQLERAERFYRLASDRANSPSEPDWQWAVFQRANCLRRTEPDRAAQLYEELLQKAPGSRWSGAAKAALDMLGWYQSLRTSSLKGLVSDPNSLSQ
jgi:tetratricopeptide (TPR) repeat protein